MSSESTKNLKLDELAKIRKNVEQMDTDELAEFRNSFDTDAMGFDGEEGATE